MASHYVYALVAGAPALALRGIGGEVLRTVAFDGGSAIVGLLDEPPDLSAAALRDQDQIVRAIASRVDAILPARFGAAFASERALHSSLHGQRQQVSAALARVSRSVQMTLRVFGRTTGGRVPAPQPRAQRRGSAGPGTRYLLERARAETARRCLAELAPVREALARLVREERIERHERPPLIASVYHLIAKDDLERYQRAVDSSVGAIAPLTLRVSGPYPPYAFAERVCL
jgi:hypothetical protein